MTLKEESSLLNVYMCIIPVNHTKQDSVNANIKKKVLSDEGLKVLAAASLGFHRQYFEITARSLFQNPQKSMLRLSLNSVDFGSGLRRSGCGNAMMQLDLGKELDGKLY